MFRYGGLSGNSIKDERCEVARAFLVAETSKLKDQSPQRLILHMFQDHVNRLPCIMVKEWTGALECLRSSSIDISLSEIGK